MPKLLYSVFIAGVTLTAFGAVIALLGANAGIFPIVVGSIFVVSVTSLNGLLIWLERRRETPRGFGVIVKDDQRE